MGVKLSFVWIGSHSHLVFVSLLIRCKQITKKKDYFACRLVLAAEACAFAQVFRLKQGVANLQFDDGLAPYNYPIHEEWKALTGYITSDLISQ